MFHIWHCSSGKIAYFNRPIFLVYSFLLVLRRFESCSQRVGDSRWWGLWQWFRLEVRLNAFCWSTIPQKQFIIIIIIIIIIKHAGAYWSSTWILRAVFITQSNIYDVTLSLYSLSVQLFQKFSQVPASNNLIYLCPNKEKVSISFTSWFAACIIDEIILKKE